MDKRNILLDREYAGVYPSMTTVILHRVQARYIDLYGRTLALFLAFEIPFRNTSLTVFVPRSVLRNGISKTKNRASVLPYKSMYRVSIRPNLYGKLGILMMCYFEATSTSQQSIQY